MEFLRNEIGWKSLLNRKQHEEITEIPENINNVENCENEINVTRDAELHNGEEWIISVVNDGGRRWRFFGWRIQWPILKLKNWIYSKWSFCNIIISYPTIQNDHNIPRKMINKFRSLLSELNCSCMPHSDNTCLGQGKLHLIRKGVCQLENNF